MTGSSASAGMGGAASRRLPLARRLRLRLARLFMRIAFAAIRPSSSYEPLQIAGCLFANKRAGAERWSAIREIIQHYDGRSVLDIGCAEGWFVRRAAEELGCFSVGIDIEDRRILLGELSILHDRVERAAIVRAMLEPSDINALPRFDIVICLSVAHHVFRRSGRKGAEEFVRALGTRAKKAVIFEMGTAEEKSLSWSGSLPEMAGGQESFVREFLVACGLTNIQLAIATPGIYGDATRLLFSAQPLGADGE